MKKIMILTIILAILCAGFSMTLYASSTKIPINVGTGTPGSLWYQIGAGIATVLQSHFPNAIITPQGVGASNLGIMRIHEGTLTTCVLESVLANIAWTGEGEQKYFGGKKFEELRFLFGGPVCAAGFVAMEKSGIKTVYDLKGKRLGYNTATVKPYAIATLSSHGIDYKKDISCLRQINQSDAVEALKNNELDAYNFTIYPSSAPILELAARDKIVFIPLDPAKVENFNKLLPLNKAQLIPLDKIYPEFTDKPILACTISAMVATSSRYSEEFIYKIAKIIFENKEELEKISTAAGEVNLDSTLNVIKMGLNVFPLHPGLVKYFKEKGIEIPSQ